MQAKEVAVEREVSISDTTVKKHRKVLVAVDVVIPAFNEGMK